MKKIESETYLGYKDLTGKVDKGKWFLFGISHFLPIALNISVTYMISYMIGLVGEGLKIGIDSPIMLLLAVVVILQPVITALKFIFEVGFIKQYIVSLRDNIFTKLFSQSVPDFEKKSRDEHLSVLVNDIEIIKNKVFGAIGKIIEGTLIIAVSAILLLITDITLAPYFIGMSLLLFAISLTLKGILLSVTKQKSKLKSEYTLRISNMISGFEQISMSDRTDVFKSKMESIISKSAKADLKYYFFYSLELAIFALVPAITTVFALSVIARYLSTGDILLSKAFFVYFLINNITEGMVMVFKARNEYIASKSVLESKILIPKMRSGREDFKFEESITMEGINKNYGHQRVLENFSLKINKNDKVLIEGRSGSGKTSILDLLSMTGDHESGTVNIDGVDITKIDPKDYYNHIGVVDQKSNLINDTIRTNIALFGDYTQEEIIAAAKKAGIHEYIMSTPKEYNTVIKESASNISGGEKQRIMIARAIIKNPDLIIMDEVTASLDEENTAAIEDMILDLDATVVYVAHKVMPQNRKRFNNHVVVGRMNKGEV